MKLKFGMNFNNIIHIFMILLFCSFTIFTTYSWGRYVMLACVVAIFAVDVVQNGFRYKFNFGRFHITVAAFALYALMSALWAIDASDSIAKSKTLLEMLFMVFVLYSCYNNKENGVSDILKIIKWSSFIIVIYSILFYGMDNLIRLSVAEARMESSYANVNTIGMLAAVGILIQVDEIVRDKKFKLPGIFCIPSVFLLALTQSRKAFAILIAGTMMVLFLRNIESENFRKKILQAVLSVVIGVIVLYLILSLPIFSGMMNRVEMLIANFTGTGKVDNSTRVRTQMIAIGWEQFSKNPILGIGIGSPHHLLASRLGMDAYLHNNFIELLAGGGIIGFLIYYSIYPYLFVSFWKYRRYNTKESVICLTIMVLFLVMDYGRVSYYNKIHYIYLMLYFLEVERLKRIARRSGL